ncbi:hypothetical protein ACFIOY_22810 [Bradyrhizobium sp. TZ2]
MADITVTCIEGEQRGDAYAKLVADGSAPLALIRPSTLCSIVSERHAVMPDKEIERDDLEATISDLLTGQFNAPVRVMAFNTLEHWIEDVSSK